jgi:hypothetical protein
VKLVALAVAMVSLSRAAEAAPPTIAAVVAADDARKAVVIGAGGEVYEPDGKGAWVHRLPSTTAGTLVAAGRAGAAIVASGEGVVYRLASNGWSAIRLVQRGKAVLGAGSRALAAVGRQVYALDTLTRGEPTKLAVAPGPIVALAAGAKAIVVSTSAGVFRIGGGKPVAIQAGPGRLRLVSERWARVEGAALDLTTTRPTAWPAGLTIGPAAAAGDALVAVASGPAGLELLTLRRGALARDPLGVSGTAVGVVVDRAGRAVVGLADGRIALRDPAGWTTTQVSAEPPPARPGAPPVRSP